MAYYVFIENEKINGKGQCKCLNEDILNIEVVEEIYNNIEKYIYSEGQIILNPNYEEEQAEARRTAFNKAFFNTSLGYIRREVSMQDGTTKTFLTDMLPQLIVGFPILAYDEPDFTIEDVNMVDYQKQVTVTESFLKECKNQLIIDFYGFNPFPIEQPSEVEE